MFLASSLNDKLKKTMIEMEPETQQTCLFPYKKPLPNAAIVTVHKHDLQNTFDSAQLQNLSKKEWENTFTLQKLHKKWNEKLNLNFNTKFKKISDDIISEETKEKKKYIKNLVDPDILEIKNKRWNKSVNPLEKNRPELKQTIFEVTHNLENSKVTPLKDHIVEEGVDTRNYTYFNDFNEKWNNSTFFDNYEKKNLYATTRDLAFENTTKYWRNTEYDRYTQEQLPISLGRKNFESPRYYKRYRSPEQLYNYYYKTMQKVKDLTWLEREKVLKNLVHLYPRNYPEKINSLANKELKELYNEKFNELIGKKKRLHTIENKKHWKDDEITEKIQTISNWNNIKWFNPISLDYDEKNETYNDFKRRKLLKPLVNKGLSIMKEEENIKNKNIEEFKKQLRKKMMQKKNIMNLYNTDINSTKDTLKISKYPIDKETHERLKKSYEEKGGKSIYTNNNSFINNNSSMNNNESNFYYDENNLIQINNSKEKNFNKETFLQAYKKIAQEDIKEQKKKLLKNRFIEYKYEHFGKYREFEFKNKIFTDPEIGKFEIQVEKINAWSCCMNTDKNSPGCRKIKIDKKKWNLTCA